MRIVAPAPKISILKRRGCFKGSAGKAGLEAASLRLSSQGMCRLGTGPPPALSGMPRKESRGHLCSGNLGITDPAERGLCAHGAGGSCRALTGLALGWMLVIQPAPKYQAHVTGLKGSRSRSAQNQQATGLGSDPEPGRLCCPRPGAQRDRHPGAPGPGAAEPVSAEPVSRSGCPPSAGLWHCFWGPTPRQMAPQATGRSPQRKKRGQVRKWLPVAPGNGSGAQAPHPRAGAPASRSLRPLSPDEGDEGAARGHGRAGASSLGRGAQQEFKGQDAEEGKSWHLGPKWAANPPVPQHKAVAAGQRASFW